MIKHKNFLFLIIVVLGYSFFSNYLINRYYIMYGVNDDEFFSLLINGQITGHKEWFTNIGESSPKIIFGILSYLFQTLNSSFNIYLYTLLSVIIISCSILTTMVLNFRKNNTKNNLMIFTVLNSLLIIFYFTIRPTYTFAAFISGFIGFICLAFGIEFKEKLYIYLSSLLMLMSYSIRRESFLISFAIFVPYIFFKLVFKKNYLKNIKITFIKSLLIFSIGLFINFFGSELIINDKNWRSYNEFNQIRYTIQDNKLELKLSEKPENFNMNFDTYQLFDKYLFIDNKIFNSKNMNYTLLQLKKEDNRSVTSIPATLKTIYTSYYKFYPILIFYIISFIILFLEIKSKKFFFINVYTLIVTSFLIIFISTNLRLPERVILSTTISFSSGIYLGSIVSIQKGKRNFIEKLSIGIIFLILTYGLLGNTIRSEIKFINNPAYSSFWEIQKDVMKSFGKEAIFVGNFSSFRSNWSNPFLSNYDNELKILRYGWYTFSPYWEKSIQKYGLEGVNLEDFVYSNNIYFVGDEGSVYSVNNILKQKNKKSYYLNLSKLDFDGSQYYIYKFYR